MGLLYSFLSYKQKNNSVLTSDAAFLRTHYVTKMIIKMLAMIGHLVNGVHECCKRSRMSVVSPPSRFTYIDVTFRLHDPSRLAYSETKK